MDGRSSFITRFPSMFNFPLDQDNESLLALASRITTLVSRQLCEPRGTDAQEAPGPSWGGGEERSAWVPTSRPKACANHFGVSIAQAPTGSRIRKIGVCTPVSLFTGPVTSDK